MEELGIPWLVRKGMSLFSSSKPALEIILEGDTMTFNIENMPPGHEFMRKIQTGCDAFEHTDQMGVKLTVTCYWEGDDFVINLAPVVAGTPGYKAVRSVTETGMTATMIPNDNKAKQMVRTFVRL